MIIALEMAIDVDLSAFSNLLQSRGVRHRISESGNNQIIWVPGEAEKQAVESLFDAYQQGIITVPQAQSGRDTRPDSLKRTVSYVLQYPVTLVFLLLSILAFPLGMDFSPDQDFKLLSTLTFVDFKLIGNQFYFFDVAYGLGNGEYWRLLTPMVIHFGWLHLVFNMVWLWEIGRRIESINGRWVILVLILICSLGSNFCQYFLTGPGLFGGMSGVVFGLLGYGFVWSRCVPDRSVGLPSGIYIFMLVYLALGFIGAIDILVSGTIANGAHLGGMIAGMLSGYLMSLSANR